MSAFRSPLITKKSCTLLLATLTLSSLLYHFLPQEESFIPYAGLFTLQFLLYALAIGVARRSTHHLPSTAWLIFFVLVARAILLPSAPVLENDYYRYLWDGHVWSAGFNPYVYAPDAEELDPIDTDYRQNVGYPEVRTIYPPLGQYLFRISHFFAPDSLLFLKFIFVLFDLATIALITRWFGAPNNKTLFIGLVVYGLNPLVLKETANSAHLDSAAVFFSTLAIYLAGRSKFKHAPSGAWLALALAAITKWYALILAPLLLIYQSRRSKSFFTGPVLLVVAIAASYLPFLSAGELLFSGTSTFGKQWIFNASIFQLLKTYLPTHLLGSVHGIEFFIPKLLSAIGFGTVLFTQILKLRTQAKADQLDYAVVISLSGLLIFSPIVNGWYLLWALPLACTVGYLPLLAWTYLVIGGYAWHMTAEYAFIFRWVEYGVLFLLMIYFRRPRQLIVR